MKKNLITILSLIVFYSNLTFGTVSDFITYEWLTDPSSGSGYADYIPHWRCLFNNMKVRGFLECGCGFSTGYFLDHAERVVTIEYVTPGYGDAQFRSCLNLFSERSNWIPILYNGDFRSNSFNNACAYQCAMHKDYALIDPTYLKELNQHFKTQMEKAKVDGHEIDAAFVHSGVYIRGDLVKLLLAYKIPVVAAYNTSSDHGTAEKTNLYGWNKVVTPPDYIKIYIPFQYGTTFWINKQYPEIIVAMLSYRDSILQLMENGYEVTCTETTELADIH